MKKKIIKIVIILIIVAILVFGIFTFFSMFMKNKFKKILIGSDTNNYELIEKYNDIEETIKVCNGILLSENEDSILWVDSLEGNRVVMDKNSKIAIVTENSKELSVPSLNHTYLEDFFENKLCKFKYLGEEGKFYLIQFTTKKTGVINKFYLNKDTGFIEKMVEIKNDVEIVTEFEIKPDTVSKAEVEYPDLSEYDVAGSSSNINIDEENVYENKVEY